jgi:hypothetical protein
MSDGPDLPRFDLRRGPWRAEVHDPRPDPLALGARYVHGGYVHALWRGERRLTSGPTKRWNTFDGAGMPETFETDLAAAHTEDGDTYLRIGAGRMIRNRAPRRPISGPDLPVRWQLVDRGEDWLTMRCQDEVRRAGRRFGYELERSIRLHDDGIESATTLQMMCGWNHPMSWFPHPFWAQDEVTETAYRLPAAGTLVGELARGDDGLVRLGENAWSSAGQVHGVWGHRGDIDCHLSAAHGGGVMRLELDRPWDHVVVWANRRASSVEPQLGRIWPQRERAGWTVRYRWLPE